MWTDHQKEIRTPPLPKWEWSNFYKFEQKEQRGLWPAHSECALNGQPPDTLFGCYLSAATLSNDEYKDHDEFLTAHVRCVLVYKHLICTKAIMPSCWLCNRHQILNWNCGLVGLLWFVSLVGFCFGCLYKRNFEVWLLQNCQLNFAHFSSMSTFWYRL